MYLQGTSGKDEKMTCLPPERKCPKCGAFSNTSDLICSFSPRDITSKHFNGILPHDEYCIFCGKRLLKEERSRPKSYKIKCKQTRITVKCLNCGYSELSIGLSRDKCLGQGNYCPKCGKLFGMNLEISEKEEEYESESFVCY